MTRRLSSEQRREQIVQATLGLLERFPVEHITTRLIAEEVGVSQPALFRHFNSRDAIFAEVVATSRQALREAAEEVLGHGADWATTARLIGEAVSAHAQRVPGLPRLFFHDLSTSGTLPAHASLRGLVEMQAGLVAGLVEDGQRLGEVPEQVDPKQAGHLFVVAVQGAMMQAVGRADGAERLAGDAVAMWLTSVRAGVPQRQSEAVQDRPKRVLVELDVRPMLAKGHEPLDVILGGLAELSADGVLLLTAPFRPGPLLQLLQGRGYGVLAAQMGPGAWQVTVTGAAAPLILDARDLEAPEPMEAVLLATADLLPGGGFAAWLPRVPRLLFPHLQRRGLQWQTCAALDHTGILHIRRPA